MAKDLVIAGAGGFGREVIDVVRAINAVAAEPIWRIVGVIDDAPSEANLGRLARLGVPCVGGLDVLSKLDAGSSVAIGIGSPSARALIADRLDSCGLRSPALIHPAAVVGSSFEASAGAVVCALAAVGTNVSLGRHVQVNPGAVIGHDCQIQDFVSINPQATISGDCRVKRGALIGAAAVVLQGLCVGLGATVGAGACVLGDVPPDQTVVGVPARPVKTVSG